MENKNTEKYNSISIIVSVAVVTLLYAVIARYFRFFYDLNDDALIASILSGSYTGVPEAHCIQMLYPVSWILTKLYGINPKFPWMGVMEIVLMWLCFVLIFARTQTLVMQHSDKKRTKIAASIGLYIGGIALMVGCFFWEMVMLQYTVVCGMLAATAAYLVLTCESFEISDNVIPICFVILAFNIRTEMLLLLCPFLATVGICKWIPEGFSLKTFKKYLGFLGIIIAGMVISYGIHYYAYSSDEWKEFTRLFNARTEVYDFTGIPNYDEHISFYDSKFVTKEDYDRMVDYNYVLSDRVNANLLEDIADYASENSINKRSLPYAIFENIKSMASWRTPLGKIELTDFTGAFSEDGLRIHIPFNTIIIILYALLVICAIFTKHIRFAYSLPICVLMRFISWGYIVYRGRVNTRIAHPLYMIEMLILVGMLFMAWCESDYDSESEKKITARIVSWGIGICMLVAAAYIPCSVGTDVAAKTQERLRRNVGQTALYTYTANHPRNYFLIDVYSSVGYTEQLFEDIYFRKANVQLAGGWAAKSPLDAQKQAHYPDKSEWLFVTRDVPYVFDMTDSVIDPENIMDDSVIKDFEMIDVIENENGNGRLFVYRMVPED